MMMTTAMPKVCALIAVIVSALPLAANAACRDMADEGASYTVCDVAITDDLRLFHSGPDGVLGSFAAVDETLGPAGQQLGFAMNAGMYHPDRSPVGLYVQEGTAQSTIVTSDGPGNFGLLPNGVFCVGDTFAVIESRVFEKTNPTCRYASQSGPMLVIDGKLHPKFLAGSPSKFIRNGVGVSADGTKAVFVTSMARYRAFTRPSLAAMISAFRWGRSSAPLFRKGRSDGAQEKRPGHIGLAGGG
jgi:uncharacterized protein YigE (DUF2233 family)